MIYVGKWSPWLHMYGQQHEGPMKTDPRSVIGLWLISLGWLFSPNKRWPFRYEKGGRDCVLMLRRKELPFMKVCSRKADGTFNADMAGMADEVLPQLTFMSRCIEYPDGRQIQGRRQYTMSGRSLIIHAHCPARDEYAELNVWAMSYDCPAVLLDAAWIWIGSDDEEFPLELWQMLIEHRMMQEAAAANQP